MLRFKMHWQKDTFVKVHSLDEAAMPRVLKWLLVTGLTVAAFFFAAYVHLWVWSVVVVNKSDATISGIRVEMARKLLWEGSLAAGNSKRLYALVEADGAAIASYEFNERRVEVHCGYVTGGPAAQSLTFVLKPGQDDCEIEF